MRRIGIVCAGLGALLALATGLLRRTAWFAAEQARAMSETEEFVVSFFWAGLILCLVGVILTVCSLRHRDEPAEVSEVLPRREETELVWVCPVCGRENADAARFCIDCGYEDGRPVAVGTVDDENWVCPLCGRVWDANASVCVACGYDRFA